MPPRHRALNRVFFLFFVTIFFSLAIGGKLVQLQIFKKGYYEAKAEEGHLGYSEVSARRGEILLRDHHSNELFRLATNTSVPLFYADPTLIKDPNYLTEKIAPLIYDKDSAIAREKQRIRELKRTLPADFGVAENVDPTKLADLTVKQDELLYQEFKMDLLTKLSQKTRQTILLYKEPPQELLSFFEKERISGIVAKPESIIAYPPQISDPDYAARKLTVVLDIPYERLRELLVGRNRYVVLLNKVPPEAEKEIRKLTAEDKKSGQGLMTGIGFQEKNYRFYPEGQLAAQVIGFSSEKGGTYGIEQSFDATLRGKKGIFKTKLDATGQQVIVGNDLIIEPAIDGDSVVLTLDRSIQMTVEKLLAKQVQDSRADSGLVIIMEPKTGRIISMAHYPTFDPNNYGKALETEDISLREDEIKTLTASGPPGNESYFLTLDPDTNSHMQVFKTLMEGGRTIISKFKNTVGPLVYRNRAVSDIWEPGSIFKVIVMAIALDDGDVTPNTTFNDTGPIKVDEFEIHNATDQYHGITTMRATLERSLNTGMAFVARRVGRELMYRYLQKFGYTDKTGVEFEDEGSGKIEDGSHWAESELITHAFGQGLAVTPIQMIAALGALTNKGILMKPHIVEQTIRQDGKITEIEPEEVRRVVSEKTAATITAMMVSVVENGGAARAKIKGFHVGGKTGTAQTYKHGKPLTGPGTTMASFVGFAPIEDPKFVMLVQIDRPRTTIWADGTAAPLFHDIAEFLFKYYNIPPDA